MKVDPYLMKTRIAICYTDLILNPYQECALLLKPEMKQGFAIIVLCGNII